MYLSLVKTAVALFHMWLNILIYQYEITERNESKF